MFSTMRVGLIGLGTMGTIHAKNLIGRSFWVRSALPVPPTIFLSIAGTVPNSHGQTGLATSPSRPELRDRIPVSATKVARIPSRLSTGTARPSRTLPRNSRISLRYAS